VNYVRVQTWLNSGGASNNGQSTVKPFLFCTDSWALRQDMSDQMFSVNGGLATFGDTDNTPFLIKDQPEYAQAQATFSAASDVTSYPVCLSLKENGSASNKS